MLSSTLSKNIYANKINSNLINANKIKANKISANQIINKSKSQSTIPSYLFSMDINEASYDSLSGLLSFNKDSVIDIIQFSDRPLRYSKDITIQEFDNLFSEGISNNFTEDKPNLVLYLPNSGQNSFELTKFEVKNGTINYTIQNIGTQTINIPSFNNQRVSLFVDNVESNQISNIASDINSNPDYTNVMLDYNNKKIYIILPDYLLLFYDFDITSSNNSDYSINTETYNLTYTDGTQKKFNIKGTDIYELSYKKSSA